MVFTAGVIAELLGGKVDGDPNAEVTTVSPIEQGLAGSLSFLANPKYTEFIYKTEASVVIVSNDFEATDTVKTTLVRVSDPYSSFAILLEQYNKMNTPAPSIHSSAIIDESATVGTNASIGAGVIVERKVIIGDNCKLHAGSRVLHDCVLGDNVTLHAGVIIGSDGFGFAPQDSEYSKIPQIGNVILEDNVEIGANTTIDRATMGSTIIRKGVKLDNLIQIAHNVEIGEHTVIAAQTGVAGSTTIGKRCMIGGQVGIVGHLTIGDNVKIAAQSGIGNNLPDNTIVQGSPAFEVGNYRRSYVYFRRLPDILKKLDNEIGELKATKNG